MSNLHLNAHFLFCGLLLTVIIAVIVLWTISHNPRKDSALAELPSPTDSENYYRPVWSSANVADGIDDDALEPEGQVRLP